MEYRGTRSARVVRLVTSYGLLVTYSLLYFLEICGYKFGSNMQSPLFFGECLLLVSNYGPIYMSLLIMNPAAKPKQPSWGGFVTEERCPGTGGREYRNK